jgi:tripartite-type tricarboxylate transporter receptor subunit TctC
MKQLLAAALLMGIGLNASAAVAQEWPSKPIRIVVPYAPGGYTDAVGRITARFMEKELGQPVVVENRAGGGGIVGSDLVSKSPGDGYTLCMCSVGAISVAPVAQGTSYDPLKSFKPLGIVSMIPQVVLVHPSLPINSMEDLIKHAKANPGKLTYGSSGAGGLTHYSVALFDARVGTKMTHVPFKGGAPATAALVAGEVNIAFANISDALPQIEANTVRALAVTSATRSEFAPKLPTITETVSPGFSVETWNGLLAPATTPDAIIGKISGVLKKMADDPEVKKQMATAGASTEFTTPAEFSAQIGKEIEQWRPLIKEIAEKKT